MYRIVSTYLNNIGLTNIRTSWTNLRNEPNKNVSPKALDRAIIKDGFKLFFTLSLPSLGLTFPSVHRKGISTSEDLLSDSLMSIFFLLEKSI